MLSYQHQFHAGNHADVLKHWLLVECILHMQKKPKAFDYIDTHAGAGVYRLDSKEAQKTGEGKAGITVLAKSKLSGLDDYLMTVKTELATNTYLGSPAIVNKLLRREDKSWLFDMHGRTANMLEKNCAVKRQTRVHQEDGFAGLNRLIPTQSRRALVLMDPSYEVKTEYKQVFDEIEKVWKKMNQTMFLLWYPVVDRSRIQMLERKFEKSAIKNVHLFEMGIAEDDPNTGMNASGLIVVNPPWTLEKRFNETMPNVSKLLSKDGKARVRYKCLVPE